MTDDMKIDARASGNAQEDQPHHMGATLAKLCATKVRLK